MILDVLIMAATLACLVCMCVCVAEPEERVPLAVLRADRCVLVMGVEGKVSERQSCQQ